MQKRGISPLIATILIISFTIVLAAVVFTWGIDQFNIFKEKSAKDSEASLKCANTEVNVEQACILFNSINLVLENVGSQDITGFFYRITGNDGSSTYDSGENLTQYSKKSLIGAGFDSIGNNGVGLPNKVEVFPKVKLDNGENYICPRPISRKVGSCWRIIEFEDATDFKNSAGDEGYSFPGAECTRDDIKIPCEDPSFGIDKYEKMQNTLDSLHLTLINELPTGEWVLVTGITQSPTGDSYVLSNMFEIEDNPRITHINLFGEIVNSYSEDDSSSIRFVLVDSNTLEEIKTLYSYKLGSITFSSKIKIDPSWKGHNYRLKIDYTGVKQDEGVLSYAALYRFCYTDENSICIV